ncbi:MAG TPA: glycosyltransferase [Candidatus Hydrogenedentes bacterium]|nr:glycosyltransferase [Candidatus Hydrogenedentota bacterium]
MRILHVYRDFDPPVRGGIEGHMALTCRIQRRWAEVEALTCSRSLSSRVIERDGTRVTEIGEWGRFQGAPIAPLFPWYLRRVPADVLVIHVPNPTAVLAYLLARPKARLVVRYHSDIVRQAAAFKVYRPLLMRFLRKADIILPTSDRYLATSPVLQEVREKCATVPLGILPETFQDPEPARVAALREAYGEPYVFFCGRHRYYKGLEYLVRAAKAIRARVVIAGGGPERARCETLARELGLAIAFPGELTHQELVDHLHGCALFVLPSVERSEAFGIALLEAHASGKPAVATRLGTGVEFVNLDGETGLNVPPRDAEALAEAVNALLADEPRRQEMGERARRRVQTEFHAETLARKELALYLGKGM